MTRAKPKLEWIVGQNKDGLWVISGPYYTTFETNKKDAIEWANVWAKEAGGKVRIQKA
jgi:hypothetical protein